jgi:membrane associated rhomboid family serine protease
MNSVPPNVSGQTNPQPQAARVPISFRLNKSKPWVTYVILIVTVLIYVIQYVSLLLTNNQYDIPAALGEKVNELILAGQVWRLITPILLHASILHVGFNMYALFVLGPGLEQYYGHRRYLLLYLIGGYAGNVLSFLLSPNPSLGASTAIFALVAAEIVFIYRNRMLFGSRARGMLLNMGVIVVAATRYRQLGTSRRFDRRPDFWMGGRTALSGTTDPDWPGIEGHPLKKRGPLGNPALCRAVHRDRYWQVPRRISILFVLEKEKYEHQI